MIWTKDSAKQFLLDVAETLPQDVKSATEFILAQFDKLETNSHSKIPFNELTKLALKNLGIDEDTLNALGYLQSLSYLPLKYTEDEKSFIEKLNTAVEVLINNPAVWYSVNNLPHEIWRDIEGYEKLYQVSNYGRLKSFYGRNTQILLAPQNGYGYPAVSLYKKINNKEHRWNVWVSRVVAITFLPNSENKCQVNHKNGVKQNNCIWNLEWVTPQENIIHAFKMGLSKPLVGEKANGAKITDEMAKYIRRIYIPKDKKFGLKALAEYFNVNVKTIFNIVHYKTFRHV